MAGRLRRFRRIIHASDSSAASRRAFATALELARATGASLLLVHVLPRRPDVSLALRTYDEIVRALRARGTKELDRLVARAKAAGVSATVAVVGGDAPAAAIVRVAKARHADVIVMGTRGRTGLARAVLGSVASRVVATAPCPVLTVRT